MKMCKVYAIASQKGGVGKTTTAANFGIGLAREGYKVLLIDADAQGSLTASLGYKEPDSMEDTLAKVIEMEVNEEPYNSDSYGILHHSEGVDLLPCNIDLSVLEVSLVGVWCREKILSKYIEKVRGNYDFIIADCMPSLSLMTINVLAAADKIIIPVQASYLSLKGLEQLIKTIGQVKRNLNSKLGIDGILITMLHNRTNFAKDIVELLDDTYGGAIHIYDSKIPHSVKAEEATAEGISIFKHAPKNVVAQSYEAFAKEVLANA